MRTWSRMGGDTICGGCGVELHRGDPVLLIDLEKVTRKLIRCQACVGEAPPDLPAVVVPSRTTKAMQPLRVAIPGVIDKLKVKA